jgi:hypothetical protein
MAVVVLGMGVGIMTQAQRNKNSKIINTENNLPN